MTVPVPRPDPIQITDSSRVDDFAALARALTERGGMTLVYAPSTTTITNTNTAPTSSGVPVEVRVTGPAAPLAPTPTQTTTTQPGFTLGDVVAYSGATLMGGGAFSGLVSALLRVPMLVPLLGGILAALGLAAVLTGATLDQHERNGAWR